MADSDKKVPNLPLNNIEGNASFTKSFDAQRASIGDLLKNIQNELYTPDITKGATFYKGLVLRKEPEQDMQGGNNILPKFLTRFLNIGTKIRTYKIRIPEIHKQIPIPERYGTIPKGESSQEEIKKYVESNIIIDQYHTFAEFSPDSPENTKIKEGDLVWCFFGNNTTFEEPLLFAKVFVDDPAAPAIAGTPSPLNSPLNQPAALSPPSLDPYKVPKPNQPIPGYNDKYLVEYSQIIEFMASSKGWPYRYGTYTSGQRPNGNDPTSPYEAGAYGVDCVGLARKMWIKLGLLNTSREALGEIGNYNTGLIARNFEPIPRGQQLPGDVIIMSNQRGDLHCMPVVTYPDSDYDSFTWACNHGDRNTNGQEINAFAGSNGGDKYVKDAGAVSFGYYKPPDFGAVAWSYFRLPDQLLSPAYANLKKSGGWPFKGKMTTNYPNQFENASQINKLPPAVIAAPSLFNYNGLSHASIKINYRDPPGTSAAYRPLGLPNSYRSPSA